MITINYNRYTSYDKQYKINNKMPIVRIVIKKLKNVRAAKTVKRKKTVSVNLMYVMNSYLEAEAVETLVDMFRQKQSQQSS
jgi:hypothetical protein